MDYSDLYAATEQEEEKKQILLIRNDPVLVQLLLVWSAVSRDYSPSRKDGWHGCHFSMSEWCYLASVPDSDLNIIKCRTLMKMNLVIPDGRIHHWVNRYLQDTADFFISTV